MSKDKNSSSNTTILLTLFAALLLALLLMIGFLYMDLGHRIELLTYQKVSTPEEFSAIANKPDGKYYLGCDIDMDGIEWVPFTFTGKLDGNGHELKNLTVSELGKAERDTYDGNWKTYTTSFAGLFDVIEGATIKNLTLSSVYVGIKTDKPCFIGTIAGYMSDSKIINCKIKGDVYLRAHDRMFGAGGAAGFGKGSFEQVETDVTIVCIDTDRNTKDEQFMGGLIAAGFPDAVNCTVNIDGYGSEHGYAHNGGLMGLYGVYPKGAEHKGKITGNRVYGKITFFEENDDRRAYCKPMIGETLTPAAVFENNGADFRAVEVTNYDADLLPEDRSDVFEFDVKTAGRFDLKAEYLNEGADATYGLFVNGRLLKKVFFPKGEGTVTEPVYLDEGKAQINFKYLPGDGNITFKDVSVAESKKTVTLIVAPHQDDEVLGFAGMIQQTVAAGNDVKVLFLTTGDYFDTMYTPIRLKESTEALKILGVDKYNITAFGYGDLTIQALNTAEDPRTSFTSKSGMTKTGADSTQNIFDYHSMRTGEPASFTGANLREDLCEYLLACRPDYIYTTSEFEWHTDHQHAFLLVKDQLVKLSKENGYHPVLCTTAIHGEKDITWPEELVYDSDKKIIAKEFTNPFPSGKTTLDWSKAKKRTLTDEQIEKKRQAIDKFDSQNNPGKGYQGTRDYNFSFCKRDEFWWEIDY